MGRNAKVGTENMEISVKKYVRADKFSRIGMSLQRIETIMSVVIYG